MEIDPELILPLRIVFAIFVALFVLNIFFILHNIHRYIIGLKMKETLVVLFYALLLVGTSARAVEYCLKIVDPGKSGEHESKAIFYTGSLALTIMVMFEVVMIVTMLRLTLSLKLMRGKIDLI